MNTDKETFYECQLLEYLTFGSGIQKEVAQEALHHDSIEDYFEDLITFGCASGIKPRLIYHPDTRSFYNTHHNEIEELLLTFEKEVGFPIIFKGDIRNYLVCFAYEEIARLMWEEMNKKGRFD